MCYAELEYVLPPGRIVVERFSVERFSLDMFATFSDLFLEVMDLEDVPSDMVGSPPLSFQRALLTWLNGVSDIAASVDDLDSALALVYVAPASKPRSSSDPVYSHLSPLSSPFVPASGIAAAPAVPVVDDHPERLLWSDETWLHFHRLWLVRCFRDEFTHSSVSRWSHCWKVCVGRASYA